MITKTATNIISRFHNYMKSPIMVRDLASDVRAYNINKDIVGLRGDVSKARKQYKNFLHTLEYPTKNSGDTYRQSHRIRNKLLSNNKYLSNNAANLPPSTLAKRTANNEARLKKLDDFDKAFDIRRASQKTRDNIKKLESMRDAEKINAEMGRSIGSRYKWGAGGLATLGTAYAAKKYNDKLNPNNYSSNIE